MVESLKRLRHDSGDLSEAIAHFSLQLANASVGNPSLPYAPQPFSPRPSDIAANVILLLSLASVLACAIAATMVEQWARQYLHESQADSNPVQRAQIRAFLHEGITRFSFDVVTESIPFLLHISVFLFFAGLVTLLLPDNMVVGFFCVGILISFFLLYLIPTISPLLSPHSPCRTPFTTVLYRMVQYIPVSSTFRERWCVIFGRLPSKEDGSLREARHASAIAIADKSDRLHKAFAWLLTKSNDPLALERIARLIPSLCNGTLRDESYFPLFRKMFPRREGEPGLSRRIVDLLHTCAPIHLDFQVQESQMKRRAATCLSAIWTISSCAFYQSAGSFVDGSPPLAEFVFLTSEPSLAWFDLRTTLAGVLTVTFSEVMGVQRSTVVLMYSKLLWELKKRLDEIGRLSPKNPSRQTQLKDLGALFCSGNHPRHKNQITDIGLGLFYRKLEDITADPSFRLLPYSTNTSRSQLTGSATPINGSDDALAPSGRLLPSVVCGNASQEDLNRISTLVHRALTVLLLEYIMTSLPSFSKRQNYGTSYQCEETLFFACHGLAAPPLDISDTFPSFFKDQYPDFCTLEMVNDLETEAPPALEISHYATLKEHLLTALRTVNMGGNEATNSDATSEGELHVLRRARSADSLCGQILDRRLQKLVLHLCSKDLRLRQQQINAAAGGRVYLFIYVLAFFVVQTHCFPG